MKIPRAALLIGTLISMSCASTTDAPDLVTVLLTTSIGQIEITVDLERAPVSGADFLRYVDAGLYDGEGFYRVVREGNDHGSPAIEVVQGGLIDQSKALSPVPHESTNETGIRHLDGAVSLARGAPGTGSAAYFFITIGEQPALDFGGQRNGDGLGFAAFGRVTRGMDVVRKIHELPADGPSDSPYMKGQILTDPVIIQTARRQ